MNDELLIVDCQLSIVNSQFFSASIATEKGKKNSQLRKEDNNDGI